MLEVQRSLFFFLLYSSFFLFEWGVSPRLTGVNTLYLESDFQFFIVSND